MLETRGWRVEVPRHPDTQLWRQELKEKPRNEFIVLPGRWLVERSFAWLGQSQRRNKDHDRLSKTSKTMIYTAMCRLMLHRLAPPLATT